MRLFIGLTLPEHVQEELQNAWKMTSGHPAGERPMRSSLWHVTLAFLDEVAEDNIEPLRQIIEKAVARPPGGAFHIKTFETFPKKKPARIVALAEPEKKAEWGRFVMDLRDMVSLVAPNVDRKPWLPHISITRGQKGSLLEAWSQPFDDIAWEPKEVAIIKSAHQQDGSHYTNLYVFPLDV
ncbi:MAG: RNA 2',3'-cyclic phosphodiesterase [Patescibacteria group bacterium]